MKARSFLAAFALGSVLLLVNTLSASAQAPLEPSQMPERTSFYLLWRGTPSPEARNTNALFALWE